MIERIVKRLAVGAVLGALGVICLLVGSSEVGADWRDKADVGRYRAACPSGVDEVNLPCGRVCFWFECQECKECFEYSYRDCHKTCCTPLGCYCCQWGYHTDGVVQVCPFDNCWKGHWGGFGGPCDAVPGGKMRQSWNGSRVVENDLVSLPFNSGHQSTTGQGQGGARVSDQRVFTGGSYCAEWKAFQRGGLPEIYASLYSSSSGTNVDRSVVDGLVGGRVLEGSALGRLQSEPIDDVVSLNRREFEFHEDYAYAQIEAIKNYTGHLTGCTDRAGSITGGSANYVQVTPVVVPRHHEGWGSASYDATDPQWRDEVLDPTPWPTPPSRYPRNPQESYDPSRMRQKSGAGTRYQDPRLTQRATRSMDHSFNPFDKWAWAAGNSFGFRDYRGFFDWLPRQESGRLVQVQTLPPKTPGIVVNLEVTPVSRFMETNDMGTPEALRRRRDPSELFQHEMTWQERVDKGLTPWYHAHGCGGGSYGFGDVRIRELDADLFAQEPRVVQYKDYQVCRVGDVPDGEPRACTIWDASLAMHGNPDVDTWFSWRNWGANECLADNSGEHGAAVFEDYWLTKNPYIDEVHGERRAQYFALDMPEPGGKITVKARFRRDELGFPEGVVMPANADLPVGPSMRLYKRNNFGYTTVNPERKVWMTCRQYVNGNRTVDDESDDYIAWGCWSSWGERGWMFWDPIHLVYTSDGDAYDPDFGREINGLGLLELAPHGLGSGYEAPLLEVWEGIEDRTVGWDEFAMDEDPPRYVRGDYNTEVGKLEYGSMEWGRHAEPGEYVVEVIGPTFTLPHGTVDNWLEEGYRRYLVNLHVDLAELPDPWPAPKHEACDSGRRGYNSSKGRSDIAYGVELAPYGPSGEMLKHGLRKWEEPDDPQCYSFGRQPDDRYGLYSAFAVDVPSVLTAAHRLYEHHDWSGHWVEIAKDGSGDHVGKIIDDYRGYTVLPLIRGLERPQNLLTSEMYLRRSDPEFPELDFAARLLYRDEYAVNCEIGEGLVRYEKLSIADYVFGVHEDHCRIGGQAYRDHFVEVDINREIVDYGPLARLLEKPLEREIRSVLGTGVIASDAEDGLVCGGDRPWPVDEPCEPAGWTSTGYGGEHPMSVSFGVENDGTRYVASYLLTGGGGRLSDPGPPAFAIRVIEGGRAGAYTDFEFEGPPDKWFRHMLFKVPESAVGGFVDGEEYCLRAFRGDHGTPGAYSTLGGSVGYLTLEEGCAEFSADELEQVEVGCGSGDANIGVDVEVVVPDPGAVASVHVQHVDGGLVQIVHGTGCVSLENNETYRFRVYAANAGQDLDRYFVKLGETTERTDGEYKSDVQLDCSIARGDVDRMQHAWCASTLVTRNFDRSEWVFEAAASSPVGMEELDVPRHLESRFWTR